MGNGGSRARRQVSPRGRDALVAPRLAHADAAHVAFAPGDEAAVHRDLRAFFGHDLTPREIASLVGAQPGDAVEASMSHGGIVLTLTGANRRYEAEREIGGIHGAPVMHNVSFTVFETGHGLGTRVFADQAHAASALGVTSIRTTAAAEDGANGYYTWPRLGYNAPFSYDADYYPSAPAAVRHASDFHELMRTSAGRDWWRANGHDVEMTFDTRPGSTAMQMLDAYLKERGIA